LLLLRSRGCQVVKVAFVVELEVKHVRIEIGNILDEILEICVLQIEIKIVETIIVAITHVVLLSLSSA